MKKYTAAKGKRVQDSGKILLAENFTLNKKECVQGGCEPIRL